LTTTDQQRRVRELFDAALDQPPELRNQFLAQACNGDLGLLSTVEKLLAAREKSAGVLDTPVWQRHEEATNASEPGSLIGPYKILRELGGGGMGIVYQAVRADQVFQRVCAVKVIRAELATDRLLERFRKERQILARLDHIHIARIVDGGSTSRGLPYFVMDYVDGPSMNQFCAEHALNIRARLALFQQVCSAAQYLHQNNVIHGDLKPPNILVGNDGLIKLVDFGISSTLTATNGNQPDTTLPLMTPGYASPEQIRGQPLTPASDVYSLGIILYELLTGMRPFPTRNKSRNEILNIITTENPTPPSIAVKTKSNANSSPQQSASLDNGNQAIGGDLDRVVLRAIRGDALLRYQSVAELNGDITNYLHMRPVAARSGDLFYTSKMFFMRHGRVAVSASLGGVLLATASWQILVADRRYERSLEYQNQVLQKEVQAYQEMAKHKTELVDLSKKGPAENSPLAKQLRDTELGNVKNLTDAYRTSFSESVRIWPGMTRSRRDLLDRAERYLREVEPYVNQDPRAPEQLSDAWLWLANLQGNPQTVNLHDRAGAAASIQEARRLLEKADSPSRKLMDEVEAAEQQIHSARK